MYELGNGLEVLLREDHSDPPARLDVTFLGASDTEMAFYPADCSCPAPAEREL